MRHPTNPIIDRSALDRVSHMRRSRYFVGTEPKGEARTLAHDILEGELLTASDATKANALAWAARILSSDNPDEADRLLGEARRLATSDEITIASAFVIAARGDRDQAMQMISSIATPLGRTAMFMLGTNGLSATDAVSWMNRSGPQFDELDGDGKLIAMGRLITAGQAPRALEMTGHVAPEDTEYSPPLHHSVAMSHLLAAVPEEKQGMLLEHLPFDWALFPLREDAVSLGHLREARVSFAAAARAAGELGCDTARQNAEDFALWLALRDPNEVAAARESLIRSMADPRDMVHRVAMAVQFGLQLDRTAVDRAIAEVESAPGEPSNDALMARFVLAMEGDAPGTLADFVNANRDRLSRLVDPVGIASIEIRALVAADRHPEAQEKLAVLRAGGTASEADLQKLDGVIAEGRGEDSISSFEERFRASNSIDDLMVLVARLQERREWRRLLPYARQLFERVNDLRSAATLARAAHESDDWLAVVEFLNAQEDFVQRSDTLRGIYAWSLYRLGDVARAREVLEPLLAGRNDENDRALQVNIAITSGDWGSLATFVEDVWSNRGTRTATELLQAGQIAAAIGSNRARELVREAVAKDPDDPSTLVTAYHAATSGGWEDDPAVAAWLQTAMAGAEEGEGPIQRMSLDDLMNMRPDWERQENDTWDQVTRGEMPLFGAAMRLNRSTISMLLTPALANLDERDPRKRGMLLTYSGRESGLPAVQAIEALSVNETTIALEASSLLVLSFLDRLSMVLDRFERTVVPHSTLRWLLDERQKAQFHQPSQVQNAHQLRNLLSQTGYFVVEQSVRPEASLIDDVGEELAVMLVTARLEGDDTQKVVVRPGPVHRPISLMRENANLSAFSDVLCGCGDVVATLLDQGHLTEEEAGTAMAYLNAHEVPWPQHPAIAQGATLLLDDLAVSNLQHLGLLTRLGMSGFRVGISRGHVDRVDALIRHESYANETLIHIEKIRAALAQGIISRKVVVGPELAADEAELARIGQHPTAGVIGLAPLVDLIVVDDRALNKFSNLDADGRNVLIGCTLDLLAMLERATLINTGERTEAETRLRRAGFQMMPLRAEELLRLVNAASIQNGAIQETAHLRSIRESIDRLRMTDALQLPLDQPWFDLHLLSIREAIRAQWNDETDDVTARARSDWLLGLLHLQGWSHRFDRSNDRATTINRARMQSWLILSIPFVRFGAATRRYAAWMEDTLITAMRSYDPASLEWLVEQVRSYIEEFAEELEGGEQ